MKPNLYNIYCKHSNMEVFDESKWSEENNCYVINYIQSAEVNNEDLINCYAYLKEHNIVINVQFYHIVQVVIVHVYSNIHGELPLLKIDKCMYAQSELLCTYHCYAFL